MTSRPPSNLIIAGVAKAGTTALFRMLGQHPAICPSDVKELNYFSDLVTAGDTPSLQSYLRHFNVGSGERYLLEASPRYFWSGRAVTDAIRRTLQGPRIVISLRDPVARFWSAYGYLQSRGRLPAGMSCAQYLDRCERWRRDPASSPVRESALTVGLYAEHVPGWLDAFGEDATVIFAERLAEDVERTLSPLYRWLELDEAVVGVPQTGASNVTVTTRSRTVARAAEAVRPWTRRALRTSPSLRAALRRAYTGLNATPRRSCLDEITAGRLRELYATSNAMTAALLTARGYRDLPAWLVTA